jgi:hypothetical protein
VAGHPGEYGGQLRLASGGRLDVTDLSKRPSTKDIRRFDVVILPDTLEASWDIEGYDLERCGFRYGRWEPSDVWNAMTRGNGTRAFERMRRYDYLAVRSPPRRDADETD